MQIVKIKMRFTRLEEQERIYGHRALSFLYGGSLLARLLLPLIAHIPLCSKFYGWLMRRPASRARIAPFIDTYRINTSEFQTEKFTSFNDFFTRKLRSECRPLAPQEIILPADGRYLAYPNLAQVPRFHIKGQEFNLETFLGSEAYGRRYAEGAMVIARLCPTDYHRFHFPLSCEAGRSRLINGALFSVNPIALAKRLSIFWENKRVITELESREYGTVLMIEIGATAVGTIQQTYSPGWVEKGQEKGYFEFGGSCIVLLFEPGRVRLAEDLVRNTAEGVETCAQMGQSLIE